MSPYTKEALEAQAEHWRQEADRQRKARFTEAIAGLVVLGLLISFTIWYTAWNQHKSDSRWCAFMVPLDQRYQKLIEPDNDPKTPAPSQDAKDFAARLHGLVTEQLNC